LGGGGGGGGVLYVYKTPVVRHEEEFIISCKFNGISKKHDFEALRIESASD